MKQEIKNKLVDLGCFYDYKRDYESDLAYLFIKLGENELLGFNKEQKISILTHFPSINFEDYATGDKELEECQPIVHIDYIDRNKPELEIKQIDFNILDIIDLEHIKEYIKKLIKEKKQEELKKDPEYKKYLELKKKFEGD